MKIIFTKDTPGQGKRGEIKEVSEGFAKNFLIAKGFAQVATPEIQAKVAKEKKEAEAKKEKEIEKIRNLKLEIEKRAFTVAVRVGERGQIFSGVHDKDVAEVISKKVGTPIDRHQVDLKKPLKELGQHTITINLGSKIHAQAKILIEAE